MQEVEITCINKDPRNDIYDSITHIWWLNYDWTKYWITQKQAIKHINNNDFSFFVIKEWKKVYVIVETSWKWNEYIKTKNDWDEPNNLLSLDECNKQIMNLPIKGKINLFNFSDLKKSNPLIWKTSENKPKKLLTPIKPKFNLFDFSQKN